MRRIKLACLVLFLAFPSGAVWANSHLNKNLTPIITYLLLSTGEKFEAVFVGRIGDLNDTGLDWAAKGVSSGENATCTSDITAEQDCHQGRDFTYDDDSDGHAGFNFVKLNASGEVQAANAPSWQCVGDMVTGLVWEVKTDDSGLHDRDDRYSWFNQDSTTNGGSSGTQDPGNFCFNYNAGNSATYCNTQAYVARVNATNLCGYSDWRMPSREELRSIVDYSVRPAIDESYFPYTTLFTYLSASPDVSSSPPNRAFSIGFTSGQDYTNTTTDKIRVRLVRSQP